MRSTPSTSSVRATCMLTYTRIASRICSTNPWNSHSEWQPHRLENRPSTSRFGPAQVTSQGGSSSHEKTPSGSVALTSCRHGVPVSSSFRSSEAAAAAVVGPNARVAPSISRLLPPQSKPDAMPDREPASSPFSARLSLMESKSASANACDAFGHPPLDMLPHPASGSPAQMSPKQAASSGVRLSASAAAMAASAASAAAAALAAASASLTA
mmetsp:Transcript_26294/g.84531  ORF Transcript_26294/g.84531 Transcript_26294/m.84531 type:complete len:212 (+) Transcript_26294:592-1227(+)